MSRVARVATRDYASRSMPAGVCPFESQIYALTACRNYAVCCFLTNECANVLCFCVVSMNKDFLLFFVICARNCLDFFVRLDMFTI